jgi:hypothetical protein
MRIAIVVMPAKAGHPVNAAEAIWQGWRQHNGPGDRIARLIRVNAGWAA